jgi:hypothetical protein
VQRLYYAALPRAPHLVLRACRVEFSSIHFGSHSTGTLFQVVDHIDDSANGSDTQATRQRVEYNPQDHSHFTLVLRHEPCEKADNY